MTIETQDGLTDEEREALETGADEEQDELELDFGDDDAGDDDKAADEKEPEAPGRDDGSDEDDEEDDDKGEPAPPAEEPAKPAAPLLVAEAPKDADATLAAISDQKKELRQKYDDGDITFDEYEEQKDVLDAQQREIERAQDMAKIAAQMEDQRRRNLWSEQCSNFLADNPEYNEKPRLHKALDAEVRELALTPEFKDRTDDKAGVDILAKAHANLVADGLIQPKSKAKPAEKEKERQAKPNLPPNIGNMPAAESVAASESRWAALDRLRDRDPIKYEEALAKMSDDQRDDYLANG